MMYCIDTNIFLRTLVNDEPEQFQECVGLLKRVKGGEINTFTPPIVIAEVGWTLRSAYKATKAETIIALRSIMGLRHLKVQGEPNVSLGLDLYEQYNIKLIDAFIASIKAIYAKEATVVSYDSDFDRLNVLCVEPSAL